MGSGFLGWDRWSEQNLQNGTASVCVVVALGEFCVPNALPDEKHPYTAGHLPSEKRMLANADHLR